MANNGGAEDEDDDDDLSSLDEDEDEEELDAEGDEDEEDAEGEEDEDISRSATPDPSKLTRRQRAEAQGLMALSNGAFSSSPYILSPPQKGHYTDKVPLAAKQKHKKRNTSPPTKSPSAAPKWHAGAKPSPRNATTRRSRTRSTAS